MTVRDSLPTTDSRPSATRARAALRVGLLAAWLGVVVVAWLAINFGMDDPGSADERFTGLWPPTHPYWFNPLIALVALVPAAWLGVSVARVFGARTKLGSAGIAFALGVIFWCLGNLVWFWYNTCTAWGALGCSSAVAAPYPSMADVGFLLLLPCWGFAMVQLARVLATSIGDVLRLAWIPLLAFAVTGFLTLPAFDVAGIHVACRSWLFDDGYSHAQTVFSLLYVCCDAVLLSFALIMLVRSRHAAGGWFFRPILLASIALIIQYAADLVFDLRVAHETEFAGDIADLLYFLALFTMLVGLHAMRGVHAKMERDLERFAAHVDIDVEPARSAEPGVVA
jgi:hypothetical protein